MYDNISGVLDGIRSGLSTGVTLDLDANTVLASILQGRPKENIDKRLVNASDYVDVNFFMSKVADYGFKGDLQQEFKTYQKKMEDSSKEMVVLQVLDSLYNIPLEYEKIIKAANDGLTKELAGRVGSGENAFYKMGDVYARPYVNPAGVTEYQILPDYRHFLY